MRAAIKDGYEVDTEGNVYSRYRKLSPVKTKAGYMQVSIGRKSTVHVHRLVAEAFVSNPNGYSTVNHIDNNKSNNNVSNLEWVTQAGNISHMIKQDRQARGESQGLAKLKEEEVLFIRANHKPHHPQLGTRPLGRKFGVEGAVINSIVKRKTWKHI